MCISLDKGDFEHRWVLCPQPLSLLILPSPLPLSLKDNYLFLKEVKNLVEKANCELKVCFQYMNRGDRWIQVGCSSWLEEEVAGVRQEEEGLTHILELSS